MRKLLILAILVFGLALPSYAKTSDEYLNDVYKLIDQKQYDEALALVQQGGKEYPGDLGLTIAFTEIQHLKGNYEVAIANYINIFKALNAAGPETPEMAHSHYNLVDAYNEVGQKHYFSKELCFRIIYHLEKTLELEPKASQDTKFIEFLRKTIGHYDVASMGTGNVKMMETGGDGAEFQLPDDYVSADEKIRYKDKAMQRLKEYDAARKASAFQTSASDKTVEDIIRLVDQRVSAIKTVHFKRMNAASGLEALLEEVTYKGPDKIKIVEPDAIIVINAKDYYVLDPQTNKVIQQDDFYLDKVSLLSGIGFYNLREALEAYNLTVDKITACPDFLTETCRDSSVDLYLITGRLKDKDKGPYPSTPKVEYFIDGQTGICLAKRDYWVGILGSGKEEELAKETIMTKIENRPDGISVSTSGKTRGYVEELANLKEDWIINILAINQDVDDQEFRVSK